MTNALPQSLNPEVVDRIANLEMRARAIVEGMISGRHNSPFFGHSVEFAQHREYVAGDDPRRIDWKVWAKSDRFYIKQFEEETNLAATLLLDTSASMDYGEQEQNKRAYASQLLACLAFLLLRQSDAVGLVTFDDQTRNQTESRNTPVHLRAILHAMSQSPMQRKTDLAKVFRNVAETISHRGLIVIASDLLADRGGTLSGLRKLRRRRHDVVVFHILHDDECDFNFRGATRFEGLEDNALVTCDPRSLREDYLKALEKYRHELRRMCGQTGIDYRFVRTSQPIDAVLAALLSERARR